MIKEITKTIIEKVKVCDICNEPVSYMCAVCNKDICAAHMVVVGGYNGVVYICSQCNKKSFSEVWDKIYTFLNTTIITYPIIQYEYQYWYRYSGGTGDYWPTSIVISNRDYFWCGGYNARTL